MGFRLHGLYGLIVPDLGLLVRGGGVRHPRPRRDRVTPWLGGVRFLLQFFLAIPVFALQCFDVA
jgi:hypothetical protein